MENGWIVCDKPAGVSCVGVSRLAKRLTQQKSIGHVGTLDPLATGILTLALGEATKLIPYLVHPTKTYEFGVVWGESRDTDDAEGRIIETSTCIPTQQEIQAILPSFLGRQQQVPPLYSAVHINGVRAYHLARKGQECAIPPREIEILNLDWLGKSTFRVTCQAGTYVRSLARDMALALGTVGHVAWLRRIDDGLFSAESTSLLWPCDKEARPTIHDSEILVKSYPCVDLNAADLGRFQQGMPLVCADAFPSWVRVRHDGVLKGMARWEDGLLKPHRILWL